jgi:hypothetical protein
MTEKQKEFERKDIVISDGPVPALSDGEKFDSRGNVPTVQDNTPDFLTVIERLTANPDVDVNKIQKILDMQEQILDRNEGRAFNASMTRAQNKIELVVAKSKNTQTGSNYAKLSNVLISAKPIYTSEGFSLMFYEGETSKENHKRTCVDIRHDGGCTKKRYIDLAIQTTGIAGKAMMTQIHGEGSTFSYGRRYLTCMIFNIPTGDDDDGNEAGKKAGKNSEFITEAEAKAITKRMNNVYPDGGEMFLEWLKVETVDTIPATELKTAKDGLATAEKAMAGKSEREPGEKKYSLSAKKVVEREPGQDG